MNKSIQNLDDLFARCEIKANGCIEWQMSRSAKGYGQTYFNGKVMRTHRIVAILTYGKPEREMQVLHSCDNKICCNPKHLRWGTNSENKQEAIERNLIKVGDALPQAKLSEDQVLVILQKLKSGVLQKNLALEYGVSKGTIQLIAANKNWKHLPRP